VECGHPSSRPRFVDARRWIARGGASIADQTMLAGGNFLVNVLLGRWLEPVQYGAFVLAYSLFQLLGTLHTAALTEPMLVFGAGRFALRFRRYVGSLVCGHLLLMGPLGLLLLGASLVLGRFYSSEVRRALAALALAGPFILLMWLSRRSFYVSLRPGGAVLGGSAYLVLMLGAVLGLRTIGRLSPASAFLAMGAGALLASLLLLWRIRPQWGPAGDPSLGVVAAEHWRYARWAIASAALTWVPGNLYFTLLPAWAGLEGTATLRALTNLVMPAVHVIGALSLLLVPLLARRRREGDERMLRPMGRFLALFLGGAGIYELGLILWRREAVQLLYGGRYADAVSLVPLVGVLALFASLIAVLGASLRALERPDKVFWSYLASSAVAIGAGIPLARGRGVAGALIGLLLSSLTTAAAMLLLYRRHRNGKLNS
jgi:O-antigen/teichoic acid export membrane protein